MQRYHLPIISLGIVSTLVLYILVTQRAPFVTDQELYTVSLDIRVLIYFGISLFLCIFSWVSVGYYLIYHLLRRHMHPRLVTRAGLKAGLFVACGITGTFILRLTQTLNIATGALLWLTLIAILWTLKQPQQDALE